MILIAFGTRPEYIKIKSLIDIFIQNKFEKYKLLFTGQHEQIIDNIRFDYKIDML